MKIRLFIVLFALVLGLSTTAVAQSFSTGSDMMNTGSSLSSNIYGVGAGYVDPMATTASSPIRRADGRSYDDDEETEVDPGNPMPIGAPYIMLLFAAGAAGVVALRRRRATNS